MHSTNRNQLSGSIAITVIPGIRLLRVLWKAAAVLNALLVLLSHKLLLCLCLCVCERQEDRLVVASLRI